MFCYRPKNRKIVVVQATPRVTGGRKATDLGNELPRRNRTGYRRRGEVNFIVASDGVLDSSFSTKPAPFTFLPPRQPGCQQATRLFFFCRIHLFTLVGVRVHWEFRGNRRRIPTAITRPTTGITAPRPTIPSSSTPTRTVTATPVTATSMEMAGTVSLACPTSRSSARLTARTTPATTGTQTRTSTGIWR